jgi:predicted secreted protein
MAPSPRHGKGSQLSIDSAAGSLVTFSSGFNEATLSRSMDTAEITTFGDNDRVYLPGLRGAELSFSGLFSSTHAEVLDGAFGRNSTASLSWEFSPDGSTAAGRHLLKGEAFISSLEYSASVDDAVAMSGTLTVTGAVTSTNH